MKIPEQKYRCGGARLHVPRSRPGAEPGKIHVLRDKGQSTAKVSYLRGLERHSRHADLLHFHQHLVSEEIPDFTDAPKVAACHWADDAERCRQINFRAEAAKSWLAFLEKPHNCLIVMTQIEAQRLLQGVIDQRSAHDRNCPVVALKELIKDYVDILWRL